MAWTIEFSTDAEEDFAKLDRTIQQRITKFLKRIEDNPRAQGKTLKAIL